MKECKYLFRKLFPESCGWWNHSSSGMREWALEGKPNEVGATENDLR